MGHLLSGQVSDVLNQHLHYIAQISDVRQIDELIYGAGLRAAVRGFEPSSARLFRFSRHVGLHSIS